MKPRATPVLEATRVSSSDSAWRRLFYSSRPAYRVITAPASPRETRNDVRRRTRLNSAKILDGASAFLCEALIQDRSASGLRLLLSRNLGLPPRFGVHDDATGEIVTASAVWRRERAIGARILSRGPPAPLSVTELAALAGLYYGMPD